MINQTSNHFKIRDLRDGYRRIVFNVATRGDKVSPRGQRTRELQSATIELADPYDSIPSGVGRRPNVAIGAAEALQLIGGFSDPELMVAITKNFDRYRDAGILHGAYGTRVRPQLETVVDRLRKDPQTRQAIISIWDPLHDLHVPDSADYPCTMSLHFLVRDHRLVLHAHMRSNDVWMGLPYDVFQFTQLQMTVANSLGLEPGHYYHHANSLHLYERDLDKVHHMVPAGPTRERGALVPEGIGDPDSRIDRQIPVVELMARARMIGEGVLPPGATRSEQWYHDVLATAIAKKDQA